MPFSQLLLFPVFPRFCPLSVAFRLALLCYATVCSTALSSTVFLFVLLLPPSPAECLRRPRGAESPAYADPTRQAVVWHRHRHGRAQAVSCPEFGTRGEAWRRRRHGRAQAVWCSEVGFLAEVWHRHRHGRAQAFPCPGCDTRGVIWHGHRHERAQASPWSLPVGPKSPPYRLLSCVYSQ